jgi:hypothetical protein
MLHKLNRPSINSNQAGDLDDAATDPRDQHGDDVERRLIGSVTSRAVCDASRGLNLLIMRFA